MIIHIDHKIFSGLLIKIEMNTLVEKYILSFV